MKLPAEACPVGCWQLTGGWKVFVVLCSPDQLWSVPLSPTLQPITHRGQLGAFASPVVLSPEVWARVLSGCNIPLSTTVEFQRDDGWTKSWLVEFEKHSELIKRNEADGLRIIFLLKFSQLNLFFSFEQTRLFSCGDGWPGTVSWRVAKSVLRGAKPSLYLTSLLRNFSNITENDTGGNWNHDEILAQPQMTAFSIVITWNSSSSVWKILFQTPRNWT